MPERYPTGRDRLAVRISRQDNDPERSAKLFRDGGRSKSLTQKSRARRPWAASRLPAAPASSKSPVPEPIRGNYFQKISLANRRPGLLGQALRGRSSMRRPGSLARKSPGAFAGTWRSPPAPTSSKRLASGALCGDGSGRSPAARRRPGLSGQALRDGVGVSDFRRKSRFVDTGISADRGDAPGRDPPRRVEASEPSDRLRGAAREARAVLRRGLCAPPHRAESRNSRAGASPPGLRRVFAGPASAGAGTGAGLIASGARRIPSLPPPPPPGG